MAEEPQDYETLSSLRLKRVAYLASCVEKDFLSVDEALHLTPGHPQTEGKLVKLPTVSKTHVKEAISVSVSVSPKSLSVVDKTEFSRLLKSYRSSQKGQRLCTKKQKKSSPSRLSQVLTASSIPAASPATTIAATAVTPVTATTSGPSSTTNLATNKHVGKTRLGMALLKSASDAAVKELRMGNKLTSNSITEINRYYFIICLQNIYSLHAIISRCSVQDA
jgi:hypothetical protein